MPRMNRRSFFRSMVGGVATAAAVRTWPLRVFSFPSTPRLLTLEEMRKVYLEPAMENLFMDFERSFPIGSTVRIKRPARFTVLHVDREVVTVGPWNPQTETLIATRGI